MAGTHGQELGGPALDLDVTERIHEFERNDLGPDELYDLREELLAFNNDQLAVQVDIEYGNSLRYDDYRAKFDAPTLTNIVMLLGTIRIQHVMHGNRRRADVVEDLAETIATHFEEWSEETGVDLEQYIGLDPTTQRPDRDHSERMKDAVHGDSEDLDVEVEQGPLDEILPDAVDEKEANPQPPEPDTPGGNSGDDDNDPRGA